MCGIKESGAGDSQLTISLISSQSPATTCPLQVAVRKRSLTQTNISHRQFSDVGQPDKDGLRVMDANPKILLGDGEMSISGNIYCLFNLNNKHKPIVNYRIPRRNLV